MTSVLQGVRDLREHLFYRIPHPGYHDPLAHLGRHVQGDHLPVLAREDVPGAVGQLDVSIVEGGCFVL